MRIFMEGTEEWFEPSGQAMVVVSKLFLVGACIAGVWALAHFTGHQTAGRMIGQQPSAIAAFVFILLSLAFYVAGKFGIFLGRKLRERGIKLP